MGFLYEIPLSIEGVFSKYDTNHDGTIDKKEAKNAKNIEIFKGFKVKKGMTLDVFEKKNRKVYGRYEQIVTEAYNKQKEMVDEWLQFTQKALEEEQEQELELLKKMENEPDNIKEESKNQNTQSTPSTDTSDEDDWFILRKTSAK